MRKFLCLILAVLIAASVTVLAVSAEGTATVTLTGLKGETITRTYNVGDTFLAATYLNLAPTGSTNVSSLNGQQQYTDSVLEVADAYEKDEDSYDFGSVADTDSMFPVCGYGAVANAGTAGYIYYNASTAANAGFQFNEDGSALIVVAYTVKAPGTATISNRMKTLAINDYQLTRIIDKWNIVNDSFNCIVDLSDALPTVSGKVTSFKTISDSDNVTVELVKNDEVIKTDPAANTNYSFYVRDKGDYVIRVSKKNHAPREYPVTVNGNLTQDVKICPYGDVNGDGKVSNFDYAKVNQHVCKVSGKIMDETDYAFKCADVNKDGKVTNFDAGKINQHSCKVKSLWS